MKMFQRIFLLYFEDSFGTLLSNCRRKLSVFLLKDKKMQQEIMEKSQIGSTKYLFKCML